MTLAGGTVAVSTPGCDEGRQMSVFLVEMYTMVAVPCIKDILEHSWRDSSSLVEWGLCMMSLSSSVCVERLHVHSVAWFTSLIGTHTM